MKYKKILTAFVAMCFAALVPSYANAQSFPPAWVNTDKYAGGDLVTDYGNIYRCIAAVNTPYLDPSVSYKNWELFNVRNNTTLIVGVGQPFPSLETAWKFALNTTISSGVGLLIEISTAKGAYSETETKTVVLNHNFGNSISIVGDNAADVVFNFKGTAGFQINDGHVLASIANMTLNSNSSFDSQAQAFSAYGAGTLFNNISGVMVNGFTDGLLATQLATINCSTDFQCKNWQDYVALADQGGTVMFNYNFEDQLTIDGSNANGQGAFDVDRGSRLYAENCSIEHCDEAFYCDHGSFVDVNGAVMAANAYGPYISDTSHVEAEGATITGSSGYDLTIFNGGTISIGSGTYGTKDIDSGTGSYIYTGH